MTTDPREQARQWLAEQICASAVEAGGRALDPPCGSCAKRAAAILATPGVQVEAERTTPTPDGRLLVVQGSHTHTQVVIRLPAQSIKEDRSDGH